MTIIDAYIFRHSDDLTPAQISVNLGLEISTVYKRLKQIGVRRNVERSRVMIDCSEPRNELYALIKFIDHVGPGILADIARRRIEDINSAINKM